MPSLRLSVNVLQSASVLLRDIQPLLVFSRLYWTYEMGRAETIYGCLSAFNIAASLIGGGRLTNMPRAIIELGLAGCDLTGRIALERLTTRGDWPDATSLARCSATLCSRLAMRGQGDQAFALAERGLTLRLAQHFDLSANEDAKWFLHCAGSRSRQGA